MRHIAVVALSVIHLYWPCVAQDSETDPVEQVGSELEVGSLDPGSMRAFSDGMIETETERLWGAWLQDPGRVEAADDKAREIFKGAALAWGNIAYAWTTYPRAPERLNLIDEALKVAPDSVVLHTLRGEALTERIAERATDVKLKDVVAELDLIQSSDLLPVRTFYQAGTTCCTAYLRGELEVSDKAGAIAVRSLEQILRSPPPDPMHQRYFAANILPIMRSVAPVLDLATPAEAVANEAEDPWLALLVAGESRRRQAWQARGSGFANTVTQEGWDGFHMHMEAAAESLMRAHELRPAAPEAAAAMIDVSKDLTGDPEVFSAWFTVCFAAQKSWMPALKEYYWALRPRWFGSVEHMSSFVQWLTQFAGESEDIANFLFTAIDDIGDELGSYTEVWFDEDLAETISAELQRQIEAGQYVEQARQRLLGIAWARKDWEKAGEVLESIGKPGSWSPLMQFHVNHRRVRNDVLLHNTKEPAEIGRGLYQEGAFQYARAAELFRKALEAPDLSEPVRDALKFRALACEWNADFVKGEAVELSIEPGLPGWEVWDGYAEEFEGRLYFGADSAYAWIRPDLDPGERYELSLTMRRPTGHGGAWSMLIYGHKWEATQQWHTVYLRWDTGVSWVQYKYDGVGTSGASPPVDDGMVNYHLICYDGEVLITADDVEVYHGPLSQGLDYKPGSRIYLAAWLQGPGRHAVVENITIKKLKERPAKLDE